MNDIKNSAPLGASESNPADSNQDKIESGLQQVAAAAMADGWMEKVRMRNGERCVSANELTSLSALIVYVAHSIGANEFRVERDLADRFNVANVKFLPAAYYDDAIRYLVDQVG
jgi:hypothetical protein